MDGCGGNVSARQNAVRGTVNGQAEGSPAQAAGSTRPGRAAHYPTLRSRQAFFSSAFHSLPVAVWGS